MLETAYELFRKQGQYFDALRVALRMGKDEAIPDLLRQVGAAEDGLMKKQMCLLLGTAQGQLTRSRTTTRRTSSTS